MTFILWWFVGSAVGIGMNYVLMQDTDNDES